MRIVNRVTLNCLKITNTMSKIYYVLQKSINLVPRNILYSQLASMNNALSCKSIHTNVADQAVKKTTTAAGGVLGLGKGKKKAGKLGTMEKKELPVETDPEKLVNYVCGSNIYITGEDVKIKEDSEYPDWLWSLHTGKPPSIEELDPNTKQYWLRVRAAGMRRNNRLRAMRKF